MNSIITYFRESVEELRQVQWPTQQQSIRLTAIVIGFLFVASVFFGVVDAGFSELLRLTINI